MRKLVGTNCVRIRVEKDLPHEERAARSGFSQQYISDLVHGKRNPTIVTIYEIAQALGSVTLSCWLYNLKHLHFASARRIQAGNRLKVDSAVG